MISKILYAIALWFLRIVSQKYYSLKDMKPYHIVEVRNIEWTFPFSDKMYKDVQVTYLTDDGKFYTIPESIFYKFHVRKYNGKAFKCLGG